MYCRLAFKAGRSQGARCEYEKKDIRGSWRGVVISLRVQGCWLRPSTARVKIPRSSCLLCLGFSGLLGDLEGRSGCGELRLCGD